MSESLKRIIPIASAVVGNSILPGAGAAIGSAVGTKATGGSWGDSLKAGIGSYVGGNIAKNFFPGGPTIGQSIGGSLGSSVANVLPASIAGASAREAFGSFAGNNLAQSLGGGSKSKSSGTGEPSFKPKEQKLTLPNSLMATNNFDPNQQSSNIATQGVYGGGSGSDEEKYFLGLINNRLMDRGSTMREMNPIESSYMAQLGLGGYNNPKDLLRAISKRSYA